MASGSSSTLSNDETLIVSYEDSSSSPTENHELELGLSLSVGHKRYEDSSSSRFCYVDDSSSSSSSSTVSAAFKTTPTHDSMAAATSGQVVGWPPIRTYRMNNTINQTKTLSTQNSNINNNKTNSNIRNSMFVKVTMDGIPIGRKIDLNAHKSYDSLSKTLEEMFLNPEKTGLSDDKLKLLADGSAGFVLTYEDKEGDWMLVGDVPWRMFIGSVKRLRIMKTLEATGTAQMML